LKWDFPHTDVAVKRGLVLLAIGFVIHTFLAAPSSAEKFPIRFAGGGAEDPNKTDIYWVDAKVFDQFRPRDVDGEGAGQLIDVGGYRLQYARQGTGTPAIVFLNGGSAPMSYWDAIVKEISSSNTAITYERAGHDRSEMGREPRHGVNVARELKALLDQLETPSPYILVAHSAGCMYARIFAALFPGDVSGLMLLDPGDKEALDEFGARYLEGDHRSQWNAYWEDTWTRLEGRPDGFGKEVQMKKETIEQMLNGELSSDLLLYVLSGLDESRPDPFLRGFGEAIVKDFYEFKLEHHRSLARRVLRGEQFSIHDAKHVIHRDRPDRVISLIRRMIGELATASD
jgi:pimeloyl-ACP methyl ester carboxylesterase